MPEAGYMHAQEFANYLRTTKATLRHYRDVGLLEPDSITESGYALYRLDQISDYLLIMSLKGAGCSLKKIKEYLSYASASELRDTLIEKVDDLTKQQQTLESRKQVLLASIACADSLHTWEHLINEEGRTWQMKDCPKEYFIKTPAPLVVNGEIAILDAIDDHIKYCLAHGSGATLQAVNGIEKNCFIVGDYESGFTLLTRLPKRIACSRLLVKPAGTYFCWLKQKTAAGEHDEADSNPLFDEYEKIKLWLEEHHLTPASDIYEAELSLYSGSKSERLYSEISMLVEA